MTRTGKQQAPTPRILAFDASIGKDLLAAVWGEERCLGEFRLSVNITASEGLVPLLESLLAACRLALGDLDAIGISRGPGSFTGLRVGLATAMTLAHSLGKPLVTVNSLELIALNAFTSRERPILVCLDGKKSQVFWGVYVATDDNTLQPVIEPRADFPEDVGGILHEYIPAPRTLLVTGNGWRKYAEVLSASLGERVVLAPENLWTPQGRWLAWLAAERYKANELRLPKDVEPLYLRASDAEIGWGKG